MIFSGKCSKFDILGLGMLGSAVLYLVFISGFVHLNHDAAWILYGAGELLNGAEFGNQIVDVNPPLAWWISFPPAFAAQLTGASPAFMFRLYVAALIGLSIALLRAGQGHMDLWQTGVLLSILVITPGYHFGQREHLMVILCLPYLGLLLKREPSSPLSMRLMTGILAGLGFCLKPHFLLIPIAVEILRAAEQRRLSSLFRIETIAMLVTGAVYAALALIFAPDYFSTVIPAALSSYSAYNNPPVNVVRVLAITAVPVLLALGALMAAGAKTGANNAFLIAAAGAVAAAFLQSKGWAYHMLPMISFLLIAVLLAAQKATNIIACTVAILISLYVMISHPASQISDYLAPEGQEAVISNLAERIMGMDEPRRVFAFITSPRMVHPAVLAGKARWSGAACCLHLLPAAILTKAPRSVAYANAQLNDIAKRLEREKPGLILIDSSPYKLGFGGTGFDYMIFLQNRPRFARLFARYSQTGSIGPFKVYERTN